MKVTALAGGVGGAKLVNGLSKIIPGNDLSVIVNTGDDFLFHGLYVCPDIDTVLYTLAGVNNPATGWGRRGETWNVLDELRHFNDDIWFHVGDKDLATHLERTRLLANSISLTAVTHHLAKKLNIKCNVLPMTNSQVRTMLETDELGRLEFQEYFVKHKFQPTVRSIDFEGSEEAELSLEVVQALEEADLVVFCPSNPFVSIAPILAVPGIKDFIRNKKTVAVSPLINGKAIKGPAAKMFQELGMKPGTPSVAFYYQDLVDGLIYDYQDGDLTNEIYRWGIIPLAANTLMVDEQTQTNMAKIVCGFGKDLV